MNFSKLKLNEGIATSGGTQSSLDAAAKSSELSTNSAAERFNRKSIVSSGKARGAAQPQTAIKSANTVMDSVDHLKHIQQQKEYTRLLESQKSDWRHELTEKAVDGQERENHPFVTVMPTGDENLIQAVKQMKDGVKDKKKELVGSEKGLEEEVEKRIKVKGSDKSTEEVAETETLLTFGQFNELYKGRHGQSEKEYQDSRSNAGKMISGDSKGSGANYSYRAQNTGSNPAGGSEKPQGQARMGSKDRAYLKMQKANLKAKNEEVVNEEGADSLKDRRMESGGVDGNNRYNKSPGKPNTFGKKPSSGMSAADIVKMAKEKLNIKEEKKKECKDGYKWDSDEGKCVKKKKSSSNTVIIGRGFGGHHHDHDHDDDSDGGGDAGDAGGGDAGGGAMGEMFDYLGQLMIEDLSTDK